MKEYYIYAYLDPETDEVKYIGKGKNNRMNTHWIRREYHWNKMFKDFLINLESPKIVKLAENLSNSEAYIEEYNLIKKHGRIEFDKNGTLFNRSTGFEHFNIPEGMSLVEYLDNRPHFNFKHISEDTKQEIISMYTSGSGLVAIAKDLSMGPGKIKQILLENNIEMRRRGGQKGDANGMYGVKRPNNAHFKGKKHSQASKDKISKSMIKAHSKIRMENIH